jgi:hypothetical protein
MEVVVRFWQARREGMGSLRQGRPPEKRHSNGIVLAQIFMGWSWVLDAEMLAEIVKGNPRVIRVGP